jgi:hypothetical protein
MNNALQKYSLGHTAVKLDCLDIDKNNIASATGFFLQRKGSLYLYTCWHVVTGIKSWQPLLFSRSNDARARRFLLVSSQDVQNLVSDSGAPIGEVIGGLRQFEITLYDSGGVPTWHQDKRDIPHEDLNSIGIHIPFWHDTVAFPLSIDLPVSSIQLIREEHLFTHSKKIGPNMYKGRSYSLGDRVFIVGYPYGFSSTGDRQPEAVVLIRHVASTNLRHGDGHGHQVLLDGPAAPGMSGSPVFVETDCGLELFGMYTHMIFPDNPGGNREKTTALGVVTELTQSWASTPLVAQADIGEPL